MGPISKRESPSSQASGARGASAPDSLHRWPGKAVWPKLRLSPGLACSSPQILTFCQFWPRTFKYQLLGCLPGRVSSSSYYAAVSGRRAGQTIFSPAPSLRSFGMALQFETSCQASQGNLSQKMHSELAFLWCSPAGLTHTDVPFLPQMLGFGLFAATPGKRLTPKPQFP